MLHRIDQLLDAYERRAITRRELLAGVAVAAVGLSGARVVGEEKAAGPTFQATELNHIALNVTDVARSRDFYIKHLGLSVMSDGPRSCFLDCGPHFLALFRSEKAGLDHYCYSVPNYDAGAAVETLKAAGFAPRREDNRVYFDDPDGLTVQVAAKNE